MSQGQPKSSPSWRLLDETSGHGPEAVMEKWFDTPKETVGPKDCTTSPTKTRILGVETTWAGPDWFGRVFGGVARLSGWSIEASLSEAQYESDFRGTRIKAKCYRPRGVAGGLCYLYTAGTRPEPSDDEWRCCW